jgi:hypothetical protein
MSGHAGSLDHVSENVPANGTSEDEPEKTRSAAPDDATYVALAERLHAPMVTCDTKLAGSNTHHATIEVYPRS